MERIKVTVVCDRCGQDTDLSPGSSTVLAFGSLKADVDLCTGCHQHLLGELEHLLEAGRSSGAAGRQARRDRRNGALTICPDCGRSFRAGAGYTLHRVRMHAAQMEEQEHEYAEATG